MEYFPFSGEFPKASRWEMSSSPSCRWTFQDVVLLPPGERARMSEMNKKQMMKIYSSPEMVLKNKRAQGGWMRLKMRSNFYAIWIWCGQSNTEGKKGGSRNGPYVSGLDMDMANVLRDYWISIRKATLGKTGQQQRFWLCSPSGCWVEISKWCSSEHFVWVTGFGACDIDISVTFWTVCA